ncbi:MAG: TIGR02147 family protein [Fibrobacteria bacterium]
MLNIFEYLSYTAYIKDYYEFRKGQNAFFSYRYMGRFLGIDPGFLVKVTQGKVHLPERAIPAVAKLCKLGEAEAKYFEALVHYGRAKVPAEIKIHFEKLISLRGMESRPLEISQYVYYQQWYHSAIRSLLTFYEFTGDYQDLASRLHPAVTAEEAEESIRLLTDLGIMERNKSGRYEVVGPPLTTGEKWQSTAIRNFQLESLNLARQSLCDDPKEHRDISTITVAIKFSDLEEIRQRIRELRQSIMHMMSDSDDPDCVYQINFQAFPLTLVGEDSVEKENAPEQGNDAEPPGDEHAGEEHCGEDKE